MHEVLVNRLGGLRLSKKSAVRSTDRPDMTLDVYRGRKTTTQQMIARIEIASRVCILSLHSSHDNCDHEAHNGNLIYFTF